MNPKRSQVLGSKKMEVVFNNSITNLKSSPSTRKVIASHPILACYNILFVIDKEPRSAHGFVSIFTDQILIYIDEIMLTDNVCASMISEKI